MNGPPPVPDALLARVTAGDADATDTWFRAEHGAVYRLCFGFLADGAEAEDQAQDAMLHLLDHLSDRDPARPYASWRNRVVLNLCRDRMRRRGARSRAEERAAEERRLAPLPRPEEAAEGEEVRAALTDSLGSLSPREREAFVLRDLEGLPTSEVAAAMGVREGSVRSLVTLARRRLRELLGQRLPGEVCP